MTKFHFLLASALLGTAACAMGGADRGPQAATNVPEADGWESVILPEDRIRLERAEDYWNSALAITRSEDPDLVAKEGALLIPGGATRAVPPPGDYRCRTIKLGVEELGGIAYDYFHCRIFTQDGQRWLIKETGSQRQSGRIFQDGTFLGGLALGEESGTIGYGALNDRNVIGFVEQLGPGRYRLVQPQPAYESTLDIMELVATT